MKRYTYRNKQTGKRIQWDTPLKDKNLVLVAHIRDGQMKGHNISQK